jgi:hypothetical protein
MPKQLFTVTLETEIVVLAENLSSAEGAAKEAQRDIDPGAYTIHAVAMRHLPGDWDLQAIPFGDEDKDDPDRTTEQWIAQGAAPLYRPKTA